MIAYANTDPDWARPRTETELRWEHEDHELGARYDDVRERYASEIASLEADIRYAQQVEQEWLDDAWLHNCIA